VSCFKNTEIIPHSQSLNIFKSHSMDNTCTNHIRLKGFQSLTSTHKKFGQWYEIL